MSRPPCCMHFRTWKELYAFLEVNLEKNNVLVVRWVVQSGVGGDISIQWIVPENESIEIVGRVLSIDVDSANSTPVARVLLNTSSVALLEDVFCRARAACASAVQRTEAVANYSLPLLEEVEEQYQKEYLKLQDTLKRLGLMSAHETLGIDSTARMPEVRKAYFGLVKRYHPDILQQYDSTAIVDIGSEIFMHIGKAYDRISQTLLERQQTADEG